ncbi:MAG: Pr6Pr family membrane protein [Patulibacter sp.]
MAAGTGRIAASPHARRVQQLVLAVAAVAVLLRLGLVIFHPDPAPDDPGVVTRLVRFVSYFTVQSNVAVLLAALAVVQRRDLDAPYQRALRLAALVGITVTGVVYGLILANDSSHEGLSAISTTLLHYVCPPLAVGAWLLAGPWLALTARDLLRMLSWPLLWIAYTLLHGAVSGWYPYGFLDVGAKGYGPVSVNLVVIVAGALLLGLAYAAVDRWRARGTGARDA